ncbi:MAG: hypothetical protein CMN06_03465 [Roseibacillus sp.]|nr:hypothetical protein [Roseibacillus sp.]
MEGSSQRGISSTQNLQYFREIGDRARFAIGGKNSDFGRKGGGPVPGIPGRTFSPAGSGQ